MLTVPFVRFSKLFMQHSSSMINYANVLFPATKKPADAKDFQKICSDIGKEARCCGVLAADQAVKCQKPVGVQ